jgi:cytochrome c oxidase subunit 4
MERPVATQTRFPRIVRRVAVHHAPDQTEYVRIAVILAILTALEVMVYYPGWPKTPKIAVFVALAATKFAIVAAFFMHLKFDGRLLTITFCAAILLAVSVFLVVLVTMHGML